MAKSIAPPRCPPKPELKTRALLGDQQAQELESMFKMLANATRLRLLHALIRSDELCVNELAEQLGMKQQAVSNQLLRLSDRGVVGSRRAGNQIFYRVVDSCVYTLLNRGWCLAEDSLQRIKKRAPKSGFAKK